MSGNEMRVGLLGLGCVGCGVIRALSRNQEEIERRAGRRLSIVAACARDLSKERDCDLEGIQLTQDPQQVVDHPEVDVVIELMGGIDPARELILRAIDQGKPVITANKHLIALHGSEVFAHAEQKGVNVAFEAAVAGSIPIIKNIRESLSGNRIEWIAGIINGTGNYILTAMEGGGRSFTEILAEAQRLGYAEADPTFDIDGTDAAHKLTILASIAFGIPLSYDRVHVEGISDITSENIADARSLGYRIKHLGIAKRTEEGIELRVHPTLIPDSHLVANVAGVMNAVVVMSDAAGAHLYYGAGAGGDPTASAVIADLVDVVRSLTTDAENRVPHLAYQPHALSDIPLLPIEQVTTACYLRLQAIDRPGVLAAVTDILGNLGISIEAIQQREPEIAAVDGSVPVILLTHEVPEDRMNQALSRIEAQEDIVAPVQRIRIEPMR
ncbi:MAG: homoserine dehydrogenase [Gammaproteobacteria bacterium]|nr:homoserine dehydrogenase [Gammaproteobacteria bacterium]